MFGQLKVGVALLVLSAPNLALAQTVFTYDSGWYGANGNHSTSNPNTYTGSLGNFSGGEIRSFYAFDLSGFAGQNVAAATITFLASGNIRSPQGTETFRLFDYLGDVSALVNGAGGTSAFADLGTGSSFGDYTISATSGSAMPQFSITLNAAGLANLNARTGGLFAVGGALSTLDDVLNEEAFFESSGMVPAAQIEMTTAVAVPGPIAGAGLVPLLGLAGAWYARRRKRAA